MLHCSRHHQVCVGSWPIMKSVNEFSNVKGWPVCACVRVYAFLRH